MSIIFNMHFVAANSDVLRQLSRSIFEIYSGCALEGFEVDPKNKYQFYMFGGGFDFNPITHDHIQDIIKVVHQFGGIIESVHDIEDHFLSYQVEGPLQHLRMLESRIRMSKDLNVRWTGLQASGTYQLDAYPEDFDFGSNIREHYDLKMLTKLEELIKSCKCELVHKVYVPEHMIMTEEDYQRGIASSKETYRQYAAKIADLKKQLLGAQSFHDSIARRLNELGVNPDSEQAPDSASPSR